MPLCIGMGFRPTEMGFSPTCIGVRRIRLNRLGTSCALVGLTSLVSSVATTRVASDTLCGGSSSTVLENLQSYEYLLSQR